MQTYEKQLTAVEQAQIKDSNNYTFEIVDGSKISKEAILNSCDSYENKAFKAALKRGARYWLAIYEANSMDLSAVTLYPLDFANLNALQRLNINDFKQFKTLASSLKGLKVIDLRVDPITISLNFISTMEKAKI